MTPTLIRKTRVRQTLRSNATILPWIICLPSSKPFKSNSIILGLVAVALGSNNFSTRSFTRSAAPAHRMIVKRSSIT